MNALIDSIRDHWFELASLVFQAAILAIIVRYARKTLKTMRASQEQVGALMRLSLSDMIADRSASLKQDGDVAPVLSSPEDGNSADTGSLAVGHSIVNWLQAPMGGGINPLRRVIRWLQAPAGS